MWKCEGYGVFAMVRLEKCKEFFWLATRPEVPPVVPAMWKCEEYITFALVCLGKCRGKEDRRDTRRVYDFMNFLMFGLIEGF